MYKENSGSEIPLNPLVRCTSLLSAYSSVRHIVLLHMTHPLLGRCALQWSHVHDIIPVVCLQGLHENGKYGKVVDSRYVAHDLVSLFTETA